MNDKVTCPHCETEIEADGLSTDETFTCPACQGQITLAKPNPPLRVARIASVPATPPQVVVPQQVRHADTAPQESFAGAGVWHIKKQWAIALVVAASLFGFIIGKSTSLYHVSVTTNGRLVRTNTLTGQTWIQYGYSSMPWQEIREP